MEKRTNADVQHKPENVPYIVYESEQMRNLAREKRHWFFHAASLVVIVLIVAAFLWYLSQYDYVSNEDVTVDGQNGVANYIGKDGDIYNGEGFCTPHPDATEEFRQE